MEREPERSESGLLWGLFVRTEIRVATVLFMVAGVAICLFFLPPDWSLGLRILAGLALGATALLSVFANHMIGGKDFN